MSWLWGAGLGFLRGGPLGALVGGTVGHFVTKTAKKKVQKRLPGIKDENLFVTSLVVILTQLAMEKGEITAREVEAIYRFFVRNLDYEKRDLEQINHVIRETIKVNPHLEPVAQKFLEASSTHYRSLLVALGYQLLLIENTLNDNTQKCINQLAQFLGMTYEEHSKIRDQYSLGTLVTPYSVLGVSERASMDEIKQAYRARLKECHPDRVAHLGESHVEEAHMKFLDIQSAYQEIETSRGN